MRHIQRKQQEGFTIIEVLIVLAIAGLIMLIVFLAVPALQRNSRNTQRKNDVSAVLGAFSEYSSNNNGQIPSSGSGNTISRGKGSPTQTVPLSIYTGINVSAVAPTSPNRDTVYVVTGADCSGTGGVVATGKSSRQYAAVFLIETTGGNTQTICQQS